MNRAFLPFLFILALLAVSLLFGLSGITGLVISQSCCTPSDTVSCPVDSACPSSFALARDKPMLEIPSPLGNRNTNQEAAGLGYFSMTVEGIGLVVLITIVLIVHAIRVSSKTHHPTRPS